MPKYRQLHLKILDSIDVNDMPDDFTRLSWVLLSLVVDGAGRGIDNPAWVRSKMYPLREDVTLQQIEKAMEWYASRQMIGRYRDNERRYFYIVKWTLYQSGTEKEAKSTIPTPDLLQSNSGPTPDLLRVNTIQYNTTDTIASSAVFTAYQNNIGMVTKITADKLDGDIKDFTAEWVTAAIDEAVSHEKRSLAYVEGILKAWKRDGFKIDTRSNGNKQAPAKKINANFQRLIDQI